MEGDQTKCAGSTSFAYQYSETMLLIDFAIGPLEVERLKEV